ncbi:MAG: hypothetical protein GVY16_02780 [Planctomycetes bacterium]|jgi:hypothetical protein|nr:hypothetical protein [Phycisphaerae bacterium]NBB94644.1 hypothetical protein [Planctomycetota bacterium]
MDQDSVEYILLDNSYGLLNLAEACLWIGIGGAFAVTMRRPAWRGRKLLAAATFICFGVSDIVETQTGAWWRPWWLFAWKSILFAGLARAAPDTAGRVAKKTKERPRRPLNHHVGQYAPCAVERCSRQTPSVIT